MIGDPQAKTSSRDSSNAKLIYICGGELYERQWVIIWLLFSDDNITTLCAE